jgi:hypothetical protein
VQNSCQLWSHLWKTNVWGRFFHQKNSFAEKKKSCEYLPAAWSLIRNVEKQLFSLRILPFRVTGLGEFSPIGPLYLYIWQLCENYESIPHIWATFFHGYVSAFILTKWVGLHFGRFFHKLIWSPCYHATVKTEAIASARSAIASASKTNKTNRTCKWSVKADQRILMITILGQCDHFSD